MPEAPEVTRPAGRPDSLGRIGVLVIDKDTVPEIEFNQRCPEGVSVHAARFASPRQSGSGDYGPDPARTVAESPDIARGLDQLGRIGLDSLALCFVTASFFGGAAFDDAFSRRAQTLAHGTPVITSAAAVRRSLLSAGARRPLLITPPWFSDVIAKHAWEYYAQAGLAPTGVHRYELGGRWAGSEPWQVWDADGQLEVTPSGLVDQVSAHLPAECDSVAVLGNGLLANDAAMVLAEMHGIPVVTSNQAALDECLCLLSREAAVGRPG